MWAFSDFIYKFLLLLHFLTIEYFLLINGMFYAIECNIFFYKVYESY